MYPDVLVSADKRRRFRLLQAALLLLNVGVVAGLVLTIRIGRPRFFGMGVIFVGTVLLLDAFVLTSRSSLRRHDWGQAMAVARDVRVIFIALCLGVATLFVYGRGLAFFGVMSLFFTLLIGRILTASNYTSSWHRTVIANWWRGVPSASNYTSSWHFDLAALVSGAALLLAAQTLTVAYYARVFDTIYHTTLARRIATYETLEVVSATRYDDLLLFHTQASVGMRITELAPRTYTAVFFAVLYALSLVIVFALVRNITGTTQVGLVGAALVAFNPQFIHWGTNAHAQGLNFVFLLAFLLVLTKWRPDLRMTSIAVVIALAIMTTHHLSTAMVAILIAVPVAAITLWTRVNTSDVTVRPVLFRYLLLVALVGYYWYETGIIHGARLWLFELNPQASAGVTTKQFIIQKYTDPVALADATVPFLLNNAHYGIFLLFAGYGLWVFFRPGRGELTDAALLVTFSFAFAILLYVPNPLWMPLRGIAVLNRWGIITLPFLLLPAVGLHLLSIDYRDTVGSLLVIVLVFGLVFTSIGGSFTDPSLADATGHEKGAQRYFSHDDIEAANFAAAHRNDSAVYGPTEFSGLLQCDSWTEPPPDTPGLFGQTVVEDGEIVVQDGLTIMPEHAFRENKIKVRIVNPEGYPNDVTIWTPVSDETVDWNSDQHNIIYDNGRTVIAYSDSGGQGTPESRCK